LKEFREKNMLKLFELTAYRVFVLIFDLKGKTKIAEN
jgi:hypothetical protein